MTYEQLSKIAEEAGFSAWAPLDVSTIELKPEVRDMCAVNSCGQYGKRWSCPPGCGTLEECAEKIKACTHGILVQTYGDIEDGFDFEAMMEIEAEHKEHFSKMYQSLRESGTEVLAIGAGCCTLCKTCTYPDAPCRFPDRMFPCVESHGILVTDLAEKHGIDFLAGSNLVTWFSLILYR